jgi:hypothetical protein
MLGKFMSHDWLIRQVERALQRGGGSGQIVVSGPLDLRVLRKRSEGLAVRPSDF